MKAKSFLLRASSPTPTSLRSRFFTISELRERGRQYLKDHPEEAKRLQENPNFKR